MPSPPKLAIRTVPEGGLDIMCRTKNGAATAARAVFFRNVRRSMGMRFSTCNCCVMIGLMKALLLVGIALMLHAQAPEGVPAPSNVRAAAYPRILPDRRVVFQLKAPSAQKVQVM